MGRFLQTDPIGYEDQINLYAYVGNDPVNKRDPSGLYKCGEGADCKKVGDYLAKMKQAHHKMVSSRRSATTPAAKRDLANAAHNLNRSISAIGENTNSGVSIVGGMDDYYDVAKGTISLNFSKIGSDVEGAAKLAHEGSHRADHNYYKNFPGTFERFMESERRAYHVQSYVETELGGYSDGRFLGTSSLADRLSRVREGAYDSCMAPAYNPRLKNPFPYHSCPR